MTVPAHLLKEIDRLAGAEGRTRSELFREAARRYIEQRQRPTKDSSRLLSRLAASAVQGPHVSAADHDRILYRKATQR